MKGFARNDLLFSLCGLNCGLCSMHLDSYCPGCGGGEGNQSCKIARCNDGRKKPFFCLTVNLLELADLKKVLEQIIGNGEIQDLPLKEKVAHVSKLFQDMADQRQIVLKLRKKPAKSGKK